MTATVQDQVLGLLRTSLQVAVPMWVENLKLQSWAQIQPRLRHCSQMIAEHGDVILYQSKKKGETARAFNALAEGLAILSFAPGGVTAFGLHFENLHPDAQAPGTQTTRQ